MQSWKLKQLQVFNKNSALHFEIYATKFIFKDSKFSKNA